MALQTFVFHLTYSIKEKEKKINHFDYCRKF